MPRKLKIGETVEIFKLETLLSGCKTANGRQFLFLTIKRIVEDLGEITGIEVKRISARRYQVVGLNSEETGYLNLTDEVEIILEPSWYNLAMLEVVSATAYNDFLGHYETVVLSLERDLLTD